MAESSNRRRVGGGQVSLSDTTTYIAPKYDGDGQTVKRIETYVSSFNNQPPTTEEVEYYVNSTVLGKRISELNAQGGKRLTNVYAGKELLAEQQVFPAVAYPATPAHEEVFWRHADQITGNFQKTQKTGEGTMYGGFTPNSAEYEALGGVIPAVDPYAQEPDDIMPTNGGRYKFGGDVSSPETGCEWNGSPIQCSMLGFIARSQNVVGVQIRTQGMEGGAGRLESMVSVWRYNKYRAYDNEDKIGNARANAGETYKMFGNRLGILEDTWYEAYVSPFLGSSQQQELTENEIKKLPRNLFDKKVKKQPYADMAGLQTDFNARLDTNNGNGSCRDKLNALLNELGSKYDSIQDLAGKFFSNELNLLQTMNPIEKFGIKNEKTNKWETYPAYVGQTSDDGKTIVLNSKVQSQINNFLHELIHASGRKGRGRAYNETEVHDAISRLEGKSMTINDFVRTYCQKGGI